MKHSHAITIIMLSDSRENLAAVVDKKGHTDAEDGAEVGAAVVSNSQQCVSEEKEGKENWSHFLVVNRRLRSLMEKSTHKKECQESGNRHWRRSFRIDCNDADIFYPGYAPSFNRYQHYGSSVCQGTSRNRVYGGLATTLMGVTILAACLILFPTAVVPLITYQGDTILHAPQQTPNLNLQNVGVGHDEHTQQGVIEQQQPQLEGLLQPYVFPTDPSPIFQNVRTIQDAFSNPRPLEEDGDVIFLWHVPQAAGSAAGSALTDMLDFCFRKTRAEKVRDPPSMDIVYATTHHSIVNMDTNSRQAISLAKEMHLLESDDVNIFQSPSPVFTQTIVSSFLWEAATLFTPHHKGRMITIMRHPIERDVSMYHDLQQASLLEYATTQHRHGDNWLVRLLTHDKHGRITEGHVNVATDLLRKYCLVGFSNPLDKSIFAKSVSRIQRYLQLEAGEPGCVGQFVLGSGLNGNGNGSAEHVRHGVGSSAAKNGASRGLTQHTRTGRLLEGSPEWNALATLHQFDLMLYENAKQIYQEQTKMFGME
jgi:hypothetical protein